jgi:hypothetical protein
LMLQSMLETNGRRSHGGSKHYVHCRGQLQEVPGGLHCML